MKYLLLDVYYSGNLNKNILVFYNLETNRIVLKEDSSNYKPYFLVKYLTQEESDSLYRNRTYVGHTIVEKNNLLNEKKEEYVKIIADSPLGIGGKYGLRNLVRYSWEDNIQFHHNFIYDRYLQIGSLYDEEFRNIDNKLGVEEKLDIFCDIFGTDKINDADLWQFSDRYLPTFFEDIPNCTRLAVDIEVDDRDGFPSPKKAKKPIISVAFSSNDGLNLVYVLQKKGHKKLFNVKGGNVVIYSTEKELIERTFKLINKYPIILTYNGDNFDFPYLLKRAEKFGIEDTPIRKVKDAWGYSKDKEVFLKNSIHIDLYKWFKNKSIRIYAYGNKYNRYGLDNVSEGLLGENKVKHDSKIGDLSLYKLAEYNLKDTQLTLKLTTYNNNMTWNLMILFCRLTHLPISDLIRRGLNAWIKSLLYYEHRENNYLIPSKEEIRKAKKGGIHEAIIEGKKYRGAFVVRPKEGIWFNVVVMDFASLYPSIIKQYNLSYETMNCGHKECKSNILRGTTHYTCTKKVGISSMIVGFLRDVRVNYFKLKSKEKPIYETIQQALKVFINGSYGVFGFKAFPFFCLPVAESTTAIGWSCIKETINKAKELGVTVLYGDTDSVFLLKPTKDQIKKLSDWSKTELNLDLEEEKTFQFLALTYRKKNYVGIKTNKQVEIKGLVGKKRNTPKFIRDKVDKLIEILKEITNLDEYTIRRPKIIKLVRDGLMDIGSHKYELSDYSISIELGKNPNQYKSIPQHVGAVLRSLNKDEYKEGDIVTFLKTRGTYTACLLENGRYSMLDVDKYKSIYKTAFEQILDALTIKWERIEGNRGIEEFFNE